ncbi:MAG: hypothetical protein ABJO64_11165 [Nitratireductor sp.]
MNSLAALYEPTAAAFRGIQAGQLDIVGSVVRHAAGPMKGQIHSFLQETGMTGELIGAVAAKGPLGLVATAVELGSGVIGNVQNEIIRQGVARIEGVVGEIAESMATLQSMGLAQLALGPTGIGVSVIGFAAMNARLSGVEKSIERLSDTSDRILAGIERLRQDNLQNEFTGLRSQVKLFEEAWHMSDSDRAARVWIDTAQATRPFQDRFEARARELLFAMPPEYALADPMVDALSLAGGLRVACLMACNETMAARIAADENARQIEGLTGNIGVNELTMARLPESIDQGSVEWNAALSDALEEAQPLGERWRAREAVAATRAAPLDQLERDGITTHDWLSAARSEKEQPVIALVAGN